MEVVRTVGFQNGDKAAGSVRKLSVQTDGHSDGMRTYLQMIKHLLLIAQLFIRVSKVQSRVDAATLSKRLAEEVVHDASAIDNVLSALRHVDIG